MASLPDSLRRQLEKAVVEAREVAEAGARAAVERLAVGRPEHFAEMIPAERELRVQLRAHARQLGDPRKANGEQEADRLVVECAYEHWHRMLFARFLAENRLLIHPEHGVPVTLTECEELAAEAGEGDGWAMAGRFAARMLPAIFRPDDPVLRLRLAPEHQQALEKCLAELPAEVFVADDSLGWVYQFWQTKRKDEVNASGKKIGADELPAVTQLFTEPYMVKFLLHNTLGAWWAEKALAARPELAATAAGEEELRRACALPGCEWAYLRFVRAEEGGPWRPAAGIFEGWPERAAEITVLDPCCGSGHFLVEAFRILVPLRMAAKRFSAREACDAVLRDNLFGLEIDDRCTQIAAFNLALAAWTYPDAGGYRPLPEIHIACSGLSVGAKEEEWLKLAGRDERLREGMGRLYRLFKDAPTLGSLIDPRREEADLLTADFEELRPLLAEALRREEVKRDAVAAEVGIAARGMAKAAALLVGSHMLVATNVPYLGRKLHSHPLLMYADRLEPEASPDLATLFLARCLRWVDPRGVISLVTPQNWLFLTTYRAFRERLLSQQEWLFVAKLGPAAFRDMNWWAANTMLAILSGSAPGPHHMISHIDVSDTKDPSEKARLLRSRSCNQESQQRQMKNPDARIAFDLPQAKSLLEKYAESLQGISPADKYRYLRCFWEVRSVVKPWQRLQSSFAETAPYVGRSQVVNLDELEKNGAEHGAAIRGRKSWGGRSVIVRQMRHLPATLGTGEVFDANVACVLPRNSSNLLPIWAFCSSEKFHKVVRKLDQKTQVTNATLAKVPFELEHWKRVAAEEYPGGLPRPYSGDPTQWIFHGHPARSEQPLLVAVARLLSYRWPAELDPDMELSDEARGWISQAETLLEFAAADGIVCIPPVLGEQSVAERLQRLLARAFGTAWTPAILSALLDQAGFSNKTLEDWLRDGFFEQHSQLFHQRPFVWHIWDGRRRDGFAALVNYHKLDRKLLERLAYTVLGDWIARQRQGVKAGERGAEDRLAAAEALQKKLALILEGEPPYDIFVRWKSLHEQPIGWEPDLNDGVRMNIRPFVEAGVLRKAPRMNWNKDRGAEPESLRPAQHFPWFWKDGRFTGERVNDVHLTNADKRAARERAAGARPC